MCFSGAAGSRVTPTSRRAMARPGNCRKAASTRARTRCAPPCANSTKRPASVSLLAEAPEWIYYDLPDDLLGKAWKGKYRGQRQRWFAFAFTGPDSEIDVDHPGGGKFEAEFDGWRWEKLSRAPALIVPFKRPAYEKVVEAFADIPQRFTHV